MDVEALQAELSELRPDPEYVRSLLREAGGVVPPPMRREVWALLLGVRKRDVFSLDDKIKSAAEDLENQRVIVADARRTRAHTDEFRSDEMQTLLVKLLTFYCKSNSLRYKQGMNEVVAPFVHVFRRVGENTAEEDTPDVFNALSAFIARFMPHIYSDDSFTSLQCGFMLFRQLLRYVDPELSAHLDASGIIPELYAGGWFMTLFAHSFPMDELLAVWDYYIVANDAQLHTWCALLVLTSHRDRLLASDEATLPITLSEVKREERETRSIDGAELCARAAALKAATPRSFLRDLRAACFAEHAAPPALIDVLQRRYCIRVAPQELLHDALSQCRGSAPNAKGAKAPLNFFVVDARGLASFERDGHLMLAFHFPAQDAEASDAVMLDAIERGEEEGEAGGARAGGDGSLSSSAAAALASLGALAAMRGRHLCIIPPSAGAAAEKEGLSAAVASSISSAAASTMSLLVSTALGSDIGEFLYVPLHVTRILLTV
jgi:hypothetical protein